MRTGGAEPDIDCVVSSLAQLIIDPYFRTEKGNQTEHTHTYIYIIALTKADRFHISFIQDS